MLGKLFKRGGVFYDLMYFQIKAPLSKMLDVVADGLPEPTKENTTVPNTHILIDIRDEFFSKLLMSHKKKPLKGIFNLFITVYEFDEVYRQLIDWVVSKLIARRDDWSPIGKSKPDMKIWKQEV